MTKKLFVILILLSLLMVSSGPAFAQGTKPPPKSNTPADLPRDIPVSAKGDGASAQAVAPEQGPADLVTVPTLTNANFEQGPHSGWTVSSTFGFPVIESAATGLLITPQSGFYAAWLGGWPSETSSISQNLSVIDSTHIRVWYMVGSQEFLCGYDFGYLTINSDILHTWNLCDANDTAGWVPLDLDLSAYAGQTVTLKIEATLDNSLNSNLFIDNISLYSTFVDVPFNHQFWSQIEAFYDAGITTGCSQTPKRYCPLANVNRAEMAVFIERALGNFNPTPNPTGMFNDVPYPGHPDFFTPFIEQFYNDGITTGCTLSPLKYCPQNNVTRGEMAVFIERALGNDNPTPDPTGMFNDVPNPNQPPSFQAFIEQFYNDGITNGCAVNPLRFCPMNNVTRQEMAVFIVRAFNIPQP